MAARVICRESAIIAGRAPAIPLCTHLIAETVELYPPARVGNTRLLASKYELILRDRVAQFKKDDQVAPQIPYQLKQIAKPPVVALVFDREGELTEIGLAGQLQPVEFAGNSEAVSSSPRPFENQQLRCQAHCYEPGGSPLTDSLGSRIF